MPLRQSSWVSFLYSDLIINSATQRKCLISEVIWNFIVLTRAFHIYILQSNFFAKKLLQYLASQNILSFLCYHYTEENIKNTQNRTRKKSLFSWFRQWYYQRCVIVLNLTDLSKLLRYKYCLLYYFQLSLTTFTTQRLLCFWHHQFFYK